MAIQLMQGNTAIGYGALAAGCRFFAGYPITPSTEVAELMSRELPKVGGTRSPAWQPSSALRSAA
jgi:2-oxoglutarate ferredoxin oxidoreductase subunit alpha